MPWVPLQPRLKSYIPQIQEDLKTHAISVYPQEDFDQDPDDRVLNDLIRVSARMLGLGMLLSQGSQQYPGASTSFCAGRRRSPSPWWGRTRSTR